MTKRKKKKKSIHQSIFRLAQLCKTSGALVAINQMEKKGKLQTYSIGFRLHATMPVYPDTDQTLWEIADVEISAHDTSKK